MLLKGSIICLHTDYVLNLALVQDHYSQEEHKYEIAPRGNSRAGEPYMRTMPCLMCKLKEFKKSTQKRVLQFVSNEVGGIMSATSAGALQDNMPDN